MSEQPRERGAWVTLRRGLALSPELRDGLAGTLLLATLATAGRLVLPVTVQATIDRGVLAPGGARPGLVVQFAALALVAIVATTVAGVLSTVRLTRAAETALSSLRVRAFRHLHDLSLAYHTGERRGALVARVTADVDAISQFMQWGGTALLVSSAQLVLALVVMVFYSPVLTAVVVISCAPLLLVLRWFQRQLTRAYDLVRTRVGRTLTVIGESVTGIEVVRAYGLRARTNARVGEAVDRQRDAAFRAGRLSATMFTSAELFTALAVAGVVVVGTRLGVAGRVTPGQLVAFLFLVNLFVSPVQVVTEVLDQAQTAIAGWRRVLGVLDEPVEVPDPRGGLELPPGAIAVALEHVGFRYGDGPPVLHDIHLELPARTHTAVVGETGAGKTTFAKLLTRLADPTQGRLLLNGLPVDRIAFSSLRRRVVMVPQDDFLFDASIADNVGLGRVDATRADLVAAFDELGLAGWLSALPDGLDTRVGQRGAALSVGERQLVALARAYVANPDLLVLDEATSAVDPETERRLQHAIEGLTSGRTAIAIAHRLSTAERADDVLVFDRGRVVERGAHDELLRAGGVYAGLHADWRSRGEPRSEPLVP